MSPVAAMEEFEGRQSGLSWRGIATADKVMCALLVRPPLFFQDQDIGPDNIVGAFFYGGAQASKPE